MERTICTDDSAAVRLGPEVIADEVRRLPSSPGVYRMLGGDGTVLYVGKAKNLKSRVTAYTSLNGHTNRIARMILETAAMEFVVTETETESLLLEVNLIKSLRPRYNVLMRDDKSFANILLATDHETAQLTKHRGARKRKGHYFGPFASAGSVNRTLNTLQKAFLLRSCEDSVFESRSRPCLLYQIKRCAAPCVGKISPDEYRVLLDEALRFLNGESQHVQTALATQMEVAADALDFEKAAALRDRIRALTYVQATQDINPAGIQDADVFAIRIDAGQACIQTFFFRAGQNLGTLSHFPRHDRDLPAEDVLEAFIAQFYDTRPPPRLVLASIETPNMPLLADALGLRAGHKVEISVPQRGQKREIVDHALTNAQSALGRRLAEAGSQREVMTALSTLLDRPQTVRRVEVYDNSHISGTNAVGGMVVATDEGLAKDQYRKFTIKDIDTAPGDDFAMMREVLSRRLARLSREVTPDADEWPDVVIVDGGEGQISVAEEAFAKAGIAIGKDRARGEVSLIGVSKARKTDARGAARADRTAGATEEQIWVPGRAPFMLPPRSAVLYYLQRLRDEAHRYAIGAHRDKRTKAALANPLDAIEGIGARRKRALLNHFGSARAVGRAKAVDIARVDGISAELAQRIFDHFNG